MQQKVRGRLKLHCSAINSSTNSQNQQENRLWKMRFWAYFLDEPSFFLNSQCSKKKTIEKKSRKPAKLWREKTEDSLNSILVPLIVQLTFRINKKMYFERWDFQHIFDDTSFLRGKGKGRGGGVEEGEEGYVNSESSDCDVSEWPWHTDASSGSRYEQSEQVLALWDHFCSFQEIGDLHYLKFSIFRLPGTVKITCFQK